MREEMGRTGPRRLRATAVPTARILGLVSMLVVIAVTISTLRKRAVVGDAVQDVSRTAAPAAERTNQNASVPRPVAGKERRDFDEFRWESEAIVDASTSIDPSELRAYWRVLGWVQAEPLSQMRKQPVADVSFHNLVRYPKTYRGHLVRVELLVRRVLAFEVKDTPRSLGIKKLYELWGWPTASNGWLYVVVTPELPPGCPTGDNVEVSVTAYGYLFKVQGYQPADAKPNARPLVAPLLMGRIEPGVAVVAAPAPANGPILAVLIGGGTIMLGVFVFGRIWAIRRKPRSLQTEEDLPWPEPADEEDESIFPPGA